MTDRECCALLADLVAIPSPSGDEAAVGRRLGEWMQAMGFRTWFDRAGNVIGEVGDDRGPTILLLGHLDTVEPRLPARIDGNVLRGRGAVDAKGPLAAMACAAARRVDAAYRVRVVGAVEEETPGGRGAVEVTRSSPPDAVIIGEPTGWDSVVFGYKGKLDLTYRAWRAPSHSSDPSEKATEAVVSFWMRLIELLGPTGPQFDLPSAALCGLDGDTTEARATVACRLPANFDVAGFVHRLRDGASQNELTVENAVAAVRRPRSDPVVRHLSRSVRARGGSPTHRLRGGTSDMNTVAAVWDVPMATYGPGDHTLEHGDQERIELDHYLRAISVLADALDGLGGELAVHHSPTIERIVSA